MKGNVNWYNLYISGVKYDRITCLLHFVWRGPGRYSDRSFFRQVVSPTGRYSDKQVDISTGLYSDRSIVRQVVILTSRYSDKQADIPKGR